MHHPLLLLRRPFAIGPSPHQHPPPARPQITKNGIGSAPFFVLTSLNTHTHTSTHAHTPPHNPPYTYTHLSIHTRHSPLLPCRRHHPLRLPPSPRVRTEARKRAGAVFATDMDTIVGSVCRVCRYLDEGGITASTAPTRVVAVTSPPDHQTIHTQSQTIRNSIRPTPNPPLQHARA